MKTSRDLHGFMTITRYFKKVLMNIPNIFEIFILKIPHFYIAYFILLI